MSNPTPTNPTPLTLHTGSLSNFIIQEPQGSAALDESTTSIQSLARANFNRLNDHVLQVTGENISLSDVQNNIKATCANERMLRDVFIIGIRVLIDTSFKWPGINLAIGGKTVEFQMEESATGGQRGPRPLMIDLSGSDGQDGLTLQFSCAESGHRPGENGTDGLSGNDGAPGQPGGDFCLVSQQPFVGFNPAIIQEINLSGGRGGAGGNGQAGGDGSNGIKGIDARTSIIEGDVANSLFGHIDMRRGVKGTPGGSGGDGGDGGIGGKGGLPGRLLLQGVEDILRGQLKATRGLDGAHGQPGAAGKAGIGEPDGFDHVIVKGGVLSPQHAVSGYELFCINPQRDRARESWASGITLEQTIARNQGRDGVTGKTAEEQNRSPSEQLKHDLDWELFSSKVAQYLGSLT